MTESTLQSVKRKHYSTLGEHIPPFGNERKLPSASVKDAVSSQTSLDECSLTLRCILLCTQVWKDSVGQGDPRQDNQQMQRSVCMFSLC